MVWNLPCFQVSANDLRLMSIPVHFLPFIGRIAANSEKTLIITRVLVFLRLYRRWSVRERTVVIIFKPFSRCWLVVFLLILPWASFAAAPISADFIPVSEINRGMKGYGLTVFEGARIDTFAVEVIGVQKKSRVDGNLIIIEVSGHGLEQSSIAQGMSGSPIYIEGRFAGALAFGWSGALRPIAGVTPARDILGLPVEPESNAVGVELSGHTGNFGQGGSQEMHSLLQGHISQENLAATVLEGAEGWSESLKTHTKEAETWPSAEHLILELLSAATQDQGLEVPSAGHWFFNPVGGESASQSSSAKSPGSLVPGAACAVPLVTGDAMLGVTGTVTWTQGDDVLMMGHPFMQRGPVNLPLATAEILTVFPSRAMSFKMGSVGSIVGSVHHDQRAGLAGKLGPAPQMIPVTVEINLTNGGTGQDENPRTYQFQVVDDPLLTPSLVFWTLYNSILTEGDDASSQNVSYELTSHWSGSPFLAENPLVIRGMAAGPGGAMALAGDWMAPFSLLLDNPFQKLELQSVQAKIELTRPQATARITGLDSPRALEIGSGPLKVQIEISPRRGEKRLVEVELSLPANLQPGPYRLVVASASEFFALESQRAAGRFQVTSLDGALKILRLDRASDELVVALLAPGKGLMLADQEMNHLPGSVSGVLKKGNMQIQATMADFVARNSQKMPFALNGHAVRKLRVIPATTPIREERRP